jgi:hypothetical protein
MNRAGQIRPGQSRLNKLTNKKKGARDDTRGYMPFYKMYRSTPHFLDGTSSSC